jgi:hypothetical protein
MEDVMSAVIDIALIVFLTVAWAWLDIDDGPMTDAQRSYREP